jgi:cation:H+ antiporter
VQNVDRVYRDVHALCCEGKAKRCAKGRAVLVLQLAIALVVVFIASDAFTNAVEWLGARYALTRSAAGAIIAAIGSSLPESIVAIVALLILRDERSRDIGLGAVLGAPFMLSTVVFCLIGALALARRAPSPARALAVPVAPTVFGAGLFFATFALALAASFVSTFAAHIVAAVLILAAYVAYLVYHLRSDQPEAEPSPPRLRIAPGMHEPPALLIATQLVLALAVTVVASRWFVLVIGNVAGAFGWAPFVVSLFISPIATELPEASNVLLWMRRREDSLALANVLGAMMFQTSVTCTLAMLATPWHLNRAAWIAAACTLGAVGTAIVWTAVRKRVEPWPFAFAGVFYAAYVIAMIFLLHKLR